MSTSKPSSSASRRPPLTMGQILAIVGVVVGLLILLDFNRWLATKQQLVDDANQAGTEVARLEVEHARLETQVAYATTDAAVVAWAHAGGKLTRPGEVLVVAELPTPQPTPVPTPAPPPAAAPTWVMWQNLFWGPAPRVP